MQLFASNAKKKLG